MTPLQPAVKTFGTLVLLKKQSTVGSQEKEVSTLKDYTDLSPPQIHYIIPQRITARRQQQQPASFQPRLKPGHRKDNGLGSPPILHHHSEQFKEDALIHCLKCSFVYPDSQEILLSIIYIKCCLICHLSLLILQPSLRVMSQWDLSFFHGCR